MKIKTERDTGISFIRVISMFLIITTHLLSEIARVSFLAKITNAAVYTFILISAYLFSKKDISNPKEWLYIRLKKILVPSYIYICILFIYKLFEGTLDLKIFSIYLFNLQGVLGTTNGAGHFWFMTTIMFCYLITLILNKFKMIYLDKPKPQKYLILLTLTLSWIVIALITNKIIGNNYGYIVFFSISYLLSINANQNWKIKNIILFGILTFILQVGRIYFNFIIDGTVAYDVIVVGISHGFLGSFYFVFLYSFKRFYSKPAVVKVIDHFDKLSYEMFITHYAFIVGPFTIWGFSESLFINITLVLVATYFSGQVLRLISNFLVSNTKYNHEIASQSE